MTDQTTTAAGLAREILARVEADPDAFEPALKGFATVCSHAVWPEDHIDGADTVMGVTGWACHLSGWKLSSDDVGMPWAFVEGWEQRRNPVEVAAELLGLDNYDLFDESDRDAALGMLRTITTKEG